MKLSSEQREGILKMMNWVEEIYLRNDKLMYGEFLKDQLLKILLLDEYDGRDKELLNELRTMYLKGEKNKV
jgi:hypothetical protein